MGGLAANIAGHAAGEIKQIRDWCNWLLRGGDRVAKKKGKGKPKPPWP